MTFRVKVAAGAAALGVMLGMASASHAAIVDWTLNGVFFDGGTFAGTFTFDTSTDIITDWDITTTGAIYKPGSGSLLFNYASDDGSGPAFFTQFGDSIAGFNLYNIPLASPGTVTNIFGTEGFSTLGFVYGTHLVTEGQAVGVLAGVPEPATWALMILGAGLGGTKLRQQRRQLICAR